MEVEAAQAAVSAEAASEASETEARQAAAAADRLWLATSGRGSHGPAMSRTGAQPAATDRRWTTGKARATPAPK